MEIYLVLKYIFECMGTCLAGACSRRLLCDSYLLPLKHILNMEYASASDLSSEVGVYATPPPPPITQVLIHRPDKIRGRSWPAL